MVFRFTPTQDCEMMRELIRLKPFAAERETTLDVWEKVAKSLSAALKVPLKVKQIRDRLSLLKTQFKASEQKSRGASGVEQSLHAVNVQSHYSDVDGLVRDYIELERLHQDAKAAKKLPKQRKEADLAQCAIDIVSESNRRRAHRQNDESGSDDNHVSEEESCVSTTESVASTSTLRSPDVCTPSTKEVKCISG
ncbi:hypothetical protein PI124_g3782 [Phytophthora idaei]|nr:hypothetical protein PI125_g15467 [Phytophthora idaei]KAG3141618.1 hypothetical protein PI126_g15426 [Phytophthora idaei]KAG3251601.1 hypothetical protein PI124_g3782 [Phytophthora idaei]